MTSQTARRPNRSKDLQHQLPTAPQSEIRLLQLNSQLNNERLIWYHQKHRAARVETTKCPIVTKSPAKHNLKANRQVEIIIARTILKALHKVRTLSTIRTNPPHNNYFPTKDSWCKESIRLFLKPPRGMSLQSRRHRTKRLTILLIQHMPNKRELLISF